jgi:hypothetical protein
MQETKFPHTPTPLVKEVHNVLTDTRLLRFGENGVLLPFHEVSFNFLGYYTTYIAVCQVFFEKNPSFLKFCFLHKKTAKLL